MRRARSPGRRVPRDLAHCSRRQSPVQIEGAKREAFGAALGLGDSRQAKDTDVAVEREHGVDGPPFD